MKPCIKCDAIDGNENSRCLLCRKTYRAAKKAKAYNVANSEKIKARQAIYRVANSKKIKECKAANSKKIKAYGRAYNVANSEKIRARQAAYRAANLEKIKACQTIYYAANPEKRKAYRRAYNRAHPESVRIYGHNRRARKLTNGGKLSQGLSDRLYKRQKGKCPCCHELLGKDFHLDHIMPLALGGKNEDINIQLLTARCNRQKKAKHPVDYMQERGFLL